MELLAELPEKVLKFFRVICTGLDLVFGELEGLMVQIISIFGH